MAEQDKTTEDLEQPGSPAEGYREDSIRHLSDMEHVRTRPGMYIGRLGDGSHAEDGIYVLLKEVIDNSIDEFRMNFGKRIDIELTEEQGMRVRDYGRGIPQGKLEEAVSQLNTGAKYDNKTFKKSVGLNGVGLKAVNALSSRFEAASYRDGKVRRITFSRGVKQNDVTEDTQEENGTEIYFVPDNTLFLNYSFQEEFIEEKLRNYTYLNSGLSIYYNHRHIISRNGLEDLLNDNMTVEGLYPIVHLKGDDIEIAFTHTNQYGEEYYSFVNGQHTTQGGTHQSAFKEHIARTIKEFFGKSFDVQDARNGIVAAIAVNVEEPMFESQTKIKLGSLTMSPGGVSVNKFIGDFIKKNVDNYLHRNPEVAEIMLQKIQSSERERKEMAGMTKLARERAKKVSLHNDKLRDCRIHYNDTRGDRQEESSIFITEGDSASGSITKSRDVATQAVFSLRGKPLNSYGMTKKVVYENKEFNLLQAALNIEDGLDGLRYNKVIVATDADVDGMHIRLLMITFFLEFFPDLIKKGHVYILQTPLFRVRNRIKKTRKSPEAHTVADNAAGAAILKNQKSDRRSEFETRYCYTEQERLQAIEDLGPNPEITRFKGLGEISPDEFKHFIGPEMRLERVSLHKDDQVSDLLSYYMGKNTMERQNFIIDNLVVEEDKPEEDFIEG
jgi:topoisomerase-4 subunit B